MGRVLKRVPLDFDYPLNTIWIGYFQENPFCLRDHNGCKPGCVEYAKIKGIPIDEDGCPKFNVFYGLPEKLPVDPPTGDGFQMWENTSEGSPQSPVFKTLDELCEWCAENATAFGLYHKASVEEWHEIFETGYFRQGNVLIG